MGRRRRSALAVVVGLMISSGCAGEVAPVDLGGSTPTTRPTSVVAAGRTWTQQPCPARRRSPAESFFDPRTPQPGELLDIDPQPGWQGEEVVHVADVELPSGQLLESGGEYLGDDSTPEPVAAPGSYPYFFVLSRYDTGARPALAQLVLDRSSPPVRWERSEHFGFVTDGGMGFIGSPESQPFADKRQFNMGAADWFYNALQPGMCGLFSNDAQSNFVIFDDGYGDGGFPGSPGYDADGKLVAITWWFGTDSWLLAGIPGSPPPDVAAAIDCQRKLHETGGSPLTAGVDC
jgi:hypothetical protein